MKHLPIIDFLNDMNGRPNEKDSFEMLKLSGSKRWERQLRHETAALFLGYLESLKGHSLAHQ